jgi:hypothetical protein
MVREPTGGAGVEGGLEVGEAPEGPAEVGQGAAAQRPRGQDLAQEDGVGRGVDALAHPALQVGQRVGEHRQAQVAVVDAHAAELVRMAGGKLPGERPLALGQDVHRECAGRADRIARGQPAVEADEQHRRVQRQR